MDKKKPSDFSKCFTSDAIWNSPALKITATGTSELEQLVINVHEKMGLPENFQHWSSTHIFEETEDMKVLLFCYWKLLAQGQVIMHGEDSIQFENLNGNWLIKDLQVNVLWTSSK
jgi:hypothetical protein